MASPLGLAQLIAMQGAASGQPAKMTGINPTNVQQAYSDYNNAAMQAYAAQLGQQNALWGGLAGLGSAGILISPKLFNLGSTAASAAPAAATTVASAAPTTLGYAASSPSLIGGAGADVLGGTAATDMAGLGAAGDAAATAGAAGGGSDLLTALLAGLALF